MTHFCFAGGLWAVIMNGIGLPVHAVHLMVSLSMHMMYLSRSFAILMLAMFACCTTEQQIAQQQIHVKPIESQESHTWGYEIELPQDREYVIRIATENIPEKGIPEIPHDSSISWAGVTAKQDTYIIRLSQEESGWSVAVEGGALSQIIPPEHTTWIEEKWKTTYVVPAGNEYAAGEIVTLLRARAVDPQTGKKSGAGMMILLTPSPQVVDKPQPDTKISVPDIDVTQE